MPRPTLLTCLLALLASPAWSSDHAVDGPVAHSSHATHTPAATGHPAGKIVAPAQRWQADAPLSRGMARLRVATGALSHGGHGHLDAGQVRAIAIEMRAAVNGMFAECRLAPDPDAALHDLLARALGAIGTLDKRGFDAGALAELEAVLARYPVLFDDAAWSELPVG